jgi:hypothetical protein
VNQDWWLLEYLELSKETEKQFFDQGIELIPSSSRMIRASIAAASAPQTSYSMIHIKVDFSSTYSRLQKP